MHIDSLIRMANQIGTFFEALPDHGEALDGIAQHLKKYWEPRMRRELLAHVEDGAPAALKGIVAEAIDRHRDALN
jgi:formate dehydrogenase subunit delta